MSEYRIEKVRRRVTVTLVGGATLDGEVFLQASARYRLGPQDPADLFNEAEPYVPLAVGSELVFVAKDQVTQVQFPAPAADTELDGVSEDVAIAVVFADGSAASGDLRLETRVDRSRLLDYLNGDHQRFMTLRSPAGVCLINRRHVAQVRQR